MTLDTVGNVGIAQASPTYKLDVTGNGHFTNLVDAANFVATSSTATSTFAGGLAVGSTQLVVQHANGNVGLGTTSPATSLQVHGVVTPDGDNTYTLGNTTYRWSAVYAANGTIQTSDRRLKSNIAPLTYGLSDILKLQPVSFTWTAQPEQGTKLGFIAQDVQPIMPETVNVGDDAAHTLGLNYTEFIPAIVRAIQELSSKLEALASTIANFAESITTKLLTAGEIHTEKLCVQGTCVTGVQLAALLSQGGSAATPISVSNSTAPDLTNSGNPADANPGPDARASSTPDQAQLPVIQINGQNPAIVHVGDAYNDLGATIVSPDTDKNLGIKTFLDGKLVSTIVIDTTQVATDTIDYVVTDPAGLAATSTRTIIINPRPGAAPPSSDTATSTPATSTPNTAPMATSTPLTVASTTAQ